MKVKAINNGYCLYCGKESKTPFCSRECYRAYVKGTTDRKEQEKQQRDDLTDRIVKRIIYIGSKGKLKYNQITHEMITEKRAHVLAIRERRSNPKPKLKKIKYCKICGKETPSTYEVYCGDECRKEKARRDSFNRSSGKKILKQRKCEECGNVFISQYGDKKRIFCSEFCCKKNKSRNSKHKREALKRGNGAESFNVISVLERDKWTCQICGIKTPRHLRGTTKLNAPELDHIIPLSRGGEHSRQNTQCLCRRCNGNKGAKEIGQLRLFG